MARSESDREDLMQEATALCQRAEFRVPQLPQTVVAGYRRDGSLSLFFGPDPIYHFDPLLRLRRAFVDGQLYRTQGQTLAQLTRVRTPTATELRRRDLTSQELAEMLDAITGQIRILREALTQSAQCLRVVPDDDELGPRLVRSLDGALDKPIDLAPIIPGKR